MGISVFINAFNFSDFMDNELENDGHDYDEVASDDGILEVITFSIKILQALVYITSLQVLCTRTMKIKIPSLEGFVKAYLHHHSRV